MKTNNSKRRYSNRRRRRLLATESTSVSLLSAEHLLASGHELDLNGESAKADSIYRHTIEVLDELSSDSSVSICEIARVAHHHGEELFRMGKYSKSRLAFERARELLDSLIVLDATHGTIFTLAHTLSWLARTQRKTGRGKESCRTYERTISLLRTLLDFPQSRNEVELLEHRLATSLFGYSKVLNLHGQKQKAARCREEAMALSNHYLPSHS